MNQPIPFEITKIDGMRVACNGVVRLAVMDEDARLFKRRGISGVALKPAAESVIPLLNQLATDLLSHLDMPAQDLANKLIAIAGTINTQPPLRKEWAVAELDGVRVYVDGVDVIVTRADLTP